MKGRRLEKRVKARKGPRYPLDQKKKKEISWALCPTWTISECFSSLPNTKKDPKKKKITSKSFNSSLFTKNTRYCSYTQSSSPWFYTLDLGFRGVGVAF